MKRNVIGVLAVQAIVASFFVSSVFNHLGAQASTPRLSLAITSVAATDHKASHVGVHTLANAALTITVLYLCTNHLATSKSLKGTEHANRAGNYTWIWTPDTKCHGNARATVIAKEYGQTVRSVKTFLVR
jgi:hypothetical protein